MVNVVAYIYIVRLSENDVTILVECTVIFG
jgi:hypothetical protein